MESYTAAFGPETADAQFQGSKIRVTIREELEGKWQQRARIKIVAVPTLPGFRIERGGDPLLIEVGVLQGERLFYKDRTSSSPWRNSRAAFWTAPFSQARRIGAGPRRQFPLEYFCQRPAISAVLTSPG